MVENVLIKQEPGLVIVEKKSKNVVTFFLDNYVVTFLKWFENESQVNFDIGETKSKQEKKTY